MKKCNDASYNKVDDECNNAKKDMAGALLMYATKCVAFQDQDGSSQCNLLQDKLQTNRNTEKEFCANKIYGREYVPY